MRDFLRDLRYAIRISLKNPVTAIVAILALALGIGVNAASFILINSMILHPLPYPRLERIMTIWEKPKFSTQREALSPGDFTDLKSQSHSFEKLAAYRGWDVNLTGTGNPERVQAYEVSPEFFSVLGKGAKLGRTFSSGSDQLNRSNVVVVSEGFWKSHLAASPDAIGKSISLSGQKYTVIGVMPDSFDYPLSADIWSPLILNPAEQHERKTRDLMVIGLIKPNVRAEASSEAAAMASRLAKLYPGTNEDRNVLVIPLRDLTDTVTNHFLWILLDAAGFVLLLACANIGNLQMARAATRQKEITVRAALGASRFQIARQLLAESILISCIAGAAGLFFASWNNDYAKKGIPAVALRIVPGLRTMHVDSTVVLFTIGLSVIAGILCSLPALFQLLYRRMGADLSDALRERGGSSNAAAPRNRIRTVLIVSELALALVLLVGAGLMVKTFEHLIDRDRGFDPRNLLTLQVSLPAAEYRDATQMRSFYDRALEGLQTVPDVRAAGVSSEIGPAEHFSIEGRAEPRAGEPRPDVISVSSRYLDAMRIPVLQGRAILTGDRPQAPHVVVISESVARHYWGSSNPVGHRIKLNNNSDWLTVVGIARDTKDGFSGEPIPAAYISYAQYPASATEFVLRTTGDPLQAAKIARSRIAAVDHDLPVYEVKTMEQMINESMSGVRAAARMMSIYALIALLLAVSGVYAVFSYFVAARTHDIGVRIALGARRADVFKMIMRQTVRLTSAGLIVGLALAIVLARIMSSALYNIVDVDWSIFAVFAGILGISALLASYLPSRRAMQIDPVTALREE